MRILCYIFAALLLGLVILCYNLLQSYLFCTLWGVNSIYLPKFFEAFFCEFSFDQSSHWLEMPGRSEMLEDLANTKKEALWLFEVFLKGWAYDTHRQMSDAEYFLAMIKRFELCLTFASFSNLQQWANIIFIDLQPLSPLSILYDVRGDYLYGADNVDYKTFIRRGTYLFFNSLLKEDFMTLTDKDRLAEFLIYMVTTLSQNADNEYLANVIYNIETTCLLPKL